MHEISDKQPETCSARPRLAGLQRLCRLYGRLQAGETLWFWDYAQACPVRAEAMPPGSARHATSERARWVAIREAREQLKQEEHLMSHPWKQYRRTGSTEMRPYIPGEDVTGISVSAADTPAAGGMIARNKNNAQDQWYVAEAYFAQHFELVEE